MKISNGLLVGLVLTTVVGAIASLTIPPLPKIKTTTMTQTPSTAPTHDEHQSLKRLFKSRPPSPRDEYRQMAKRTARKVKKRYAELSSLSMDITIETTPKTVVVKKESVMRPQAFTCKVSVNGIPLYDFAFLDGKITEHRFPFRGSSDQSIVYDVGANKYSGMGECRFQDGIPSRWLCLIAGHGQTWVGPHIKMGNIQLMCDRLEENSWFTGYATVDGFSCMTFFYKYDGINGGEKYYIDTKSSLLRKWVYFFIEPDTVTSVCIQCRIRSIEGGDATGPK